MAKLSDKELAASYGWALATLNSEPDLKKLFQTAVKKQYTPERFIAEMRNTKWFQSTSESQRKYLVLKTADPAQYVAQVSALMDSLADQYSKLTGEVLEVNKPVVGNDGKITAGTGFLATVADEALRLGMNEAQLRNRLYGAVDWQRKVAEGELNGSLSGNLQQMRQQAAALGVDPSEEWFANRVSAIALEEDTPEGALGALRNMAKDRYTAYADRIDAGETMQDITESYRQSMSKILEINPGEIDVFDNQVQNAITHRNEAGEDAPMSIAQFEDALRRDDRWQYTQNAKEKLLSTGQNLLRSFGLVG